MELDILTSQLELDIKYIHNHVYLTFLNTV